CAVRAGNLFQAACHVLLAADRGWIPFVFAAVPFDPPRHRRGLGSEVRSIGAARAGFPPAERWRRYLPKGADRTDEAEGHDALRSQPGGCTGNGVGIYVA